MRGKAVSFAGEDKFHWCAAILLTYALFYATIKIQKAALAVNRKGVFPMEFLKQLWPTPFKVQEKDVKSLVVQLIIFILLIAVFSVLIGILALIPIIGIVFAIVGSLIDLYSLIGIVLCVLNFFAVLK